MLGAGSIHHFVSWWGDCAEGVSPERLEMKSSDQSARVLRAEVISGIFAGRTQARWCWDSLVSPPTARWQENADILEKVKAPRFARATGNALSHSTVLCSWHQTDVFILFYYISSFFFVFFCPYLGSKCYNLWKGHFLKWHQLGMLAEIIRKRVLYLNGQML